MRRVELEPGLLERVIGRRSPVPGARDDMAADRLSRAIDRLEPDPLFRRRLRGSVVNYYVAAREGHLRRPRRERRQMGKLGRAVLYASVSLALGVSTVGAVSQNSLPGDPLYGVKLRLEEIRMQIAPPASRDVLAELALAERTRELQRQVAAGTWDRVPAAAQRVAVAEAARLAVDPSAVDATATGHAISVLATVLESAPEAARAGLQNAIQAAGDAPAAPEAHASPEAPGKANGATGAESTHPPKPSQAASPSHPPSDDGRRASH